MLLRPEEERGRVARCNGITLCRVLNDNFSIVSPTILKVNVHKVYIQGVCQILIARLWEYYQVFRVKLLKTDFILFCRVI